MKINKTAAERLAAFIATLRADWDTPGIVAAIGRAANRGDAWQLAQAAIRAASDPANRTPAVIALDGRHWRPPAAEEQATPTPPPYVSPRIDPDVQVAVNARGGLMARQQLREARASTAIDGDTYAVDGPADGEDAP